MALPSASIFPLDHAIFKHYMELDVKEIQAEYVWIGGSGSDLRSKTRTVTDLKEVHSPEQLPIWNYDGSSTGQAPGRDSEVYLKPASVYRDPFRRGKHVLVLCESILPDGKETPIPTNTRNHAAKIMERAAAQEPWFGVEQEFTLFQPDGVTPLGWPHGGYPGPQGPYYCSAGAEVSFGRRIVEAHYRACLYAGLKIAGCNAEVMAGQWEYQVGPCLGIECGDQVTMARYIMQRVCEDFGCLVSFHPKPKSGDWNGAGCHTNFSTKAMREEGGFEVILSAIKKLGAKHDEHIAVYGKDNEKRLTGAHETAPIDKFSYGVANRGASIRIPRQSKLQGKGYFEDRRPASNMDPYVVSAKIVQTVCLDE